MIILNMTEEDEIDVLGDFNLDNLLAKNDTNIYDNATLVSQNTDLLNCDYTIHPQWLLDKPSANPDIWYDSNLSTSLSSEGELSGHVSTENCITDESGWTEKEKSLLERGIEIFGKSNIRLSQFIGSKTSSEVKYYLKNFYLENQTGYKGFGECIASDNLISDIVDETQIPASIEEVIASVSTAKPTVHSNKKTRKKSSSCSSGTQEFDTKYINSDKFSFKANLKRIEPNRLINIQEHNIKRGRRKKGKMQPPAKFKAKIKLPIDHANKYLNQKIIKRIDENNKTEISKVEITTGKGLSVPICEGEEIIKIQKGGENSDSDIDIDVEDSDEQIANKDSLVTLMENQEQTVSEKSQEPQTNATKEINKFPEEKDIIEKEKPTKEMVDLSALDNKVAQELLSLDTPKEELILDDQQISELEKVVHNEFFTGKPTKTPMRYLKIRNHIINSWRSARPNYLTKTSIRQGLKNCGDVHCMGRIHQFLEQIGVINFGCAQTNYVRPLYDLLHYQTPTRDKSTKQTKPSLQRENGQLGARPRVKKKFQNDGEGGCTLTHDSKGDVINTTFVQEEPAVKQHRTYIKKPLIKLIYCRPFTVENPQQYVIRIDLSTLLCMDFHAHTSLTEVMGLVGGYWTPQNKTLFISHYEPCRNIASSATHCDMCPVSQAKAADVIHCQDLDILGWFHSHPTFAPEPSQQDLETQQFLQQSLSHDKPCIGVILSPFNSNGAIISSPFRCMIVDKKTNFEDQFVPYKFKVDVCAERFDEMDFLRNVERIFNSEISTDESRICFEKPYFLDANISYLDKFLSSVNMHLAKCGSLSKPTCDNIIRGITQIVSKKGDTT